MKSLCLCLLLLCLTWVWPANSGTYASSPNEKAATWQMKAKQARASIAGAPVGAVKIDGRWRTAGTLVVEALQALQQDQKASDTDPELKEFLAGDITELVAGCRDVETVDSVAKWEYSVTKK